LTGGAGTSVYARPCASKAQPSVAAASSVQRQATPGPPALRCAARRSSRSACAGFKVRARAVQRCCTSGWLQACSMTARTCSRGTAPRADSRRASMAFMKRK
jgi:hypothetical protein